MSTEMVHKTVFKACNKPNMPQLRQQRQQPLKRTLQLIMKPMLAKSPNWEPLYTEYGT